MNERPLIENKKYLSELSFILSHEFIFFKKILPPAQEESVDFFIDNYQSGLSIPNVFRRSNVVNENHDDKINALYKVIEKVTNYLDFLKNKPDTNVFFNFETAPFFWLENEREKMSQTIYETSDENDPSISKFIEYRRKLQFDSLSDIDLNSLEKRIALMLLEGNSYHEVACKLNLELHNILRIIELTERKIGEVKTDSELIIEFLKMEPSLRKVLFLALVGESIPAIANRLQTTISAVEASVHRLRERYEENSFDLKRVNSFDIEFINKKSIPPNRQFQEKIFNIESQDLNTIVEKYLANSNSRYRDGIKRLYQAKEYGYIKLYFLLCEVPDRVLVASLIGLSEVTTKVRIAEVKKAILPEDHPAIELKDYENWVEITINGFKFLLSDLDLQIVDVIKKQYYSSRLSRHSISEVLEIPASTVKNRVNKMLTWLKVKDLKSIVDVIDNTREG